MTQHELDGEFIRTYPALSALFKRQVELTPQHAPSLLKRLTQYDNPHLEIADEFAGWIKRLAGDQLDRVLQDYDWICQLVLEEELFFRRNNRYRLTTFQEAVEQVYSNDELMDHYMNGLLLTQVWWANHTESARFYRDAFLGRFDKPFSHLEIGPGHGFLLVLAGREALCRDITAWDVAEASIEQTRHAAKLLGLDKEIDLQVQDLFDAKDAGKRFDSIVLSEVLEHLERPREALQAIHGLLSRDGRLYVNMPVNSPAPDHLFLLRSPEEVVDFIAESGFEIEESKFEPQTNMTLEKARRTQSTISVVVIARPRAD